jgi:nicotinate-nucleotide pyrophosphorylase (carboxylating)
LEKFRKIAESRAKIALQDDAKEDITTKALGLKGDAKASIIAEEAGVLCGLLEAKAVLEGLKITAKLKEGGKFKKGQTILNMEGDISEILKRERTALNYLQVLSGIATQTNELVERIGNGKVAAIRKNHPLLTESEKRAVQVGGGMTHRINLSDGYLIKNTHLEWLRERKGLSVGEAVRVAVERALTYRKKSKHKYFVEVEVMGLQEALAAAKTKADAVLVDNKNPPKFAQIAKSIREINKKIIIEASGGITPGNAQAYLEAGADFVSMGYLVMRSKPIGMHLRLIY